MENKFDLTSFKRPCTVVLDTDTYNEIDDQFALLYSLYSPEDIRLAGVTAAPFHNNRSENYAEHNRYDYHKNTYKFYFQPFNHSVLPPDDSRAFLLLQC